MYKRCGWKKFSCRDYGGVFYRGKSRLPFFRIDPSRKQSARLFPSLLFPYIFGGGGNVWETEGNGKARALVSGRGLPELDLPEFPGPPLPHTSQNVWEKQGVTGNLGKSSR